MAKPKGPTVLVFVIDAVGIKTLEYLLNSYPHRISLPNLSRLGLRTLLKRRDARSMIMRARALCLHQASASADSVIGHREMVGIIDERTYDLFPEGFSSVYIAELERRIGRKTIFNKMAGGIEAIEMNTREHKQTGSPIVYSSKCDPLIQIAMDEDVIPAPEQHRIIEIAFALALEMRIPINRGIARAYKMSGDEVVRTANRHDVVLPLSGCTLCDILYDKKVWTVAVGKTSDLVNTRYHEQSHIIDPSFLDPYWKMNFVHPKRKDTNPFVFQGVFNALLSARMLYRPYGTFIFANAVDTDSLWGHTRDIEGSLRCLHEIDRMIFKFETMMQPGDLLIITADHGMRHGDDYGYHNVEPLPLLIERIGFYKDLGGIETGTGEGLTEVGMLAAQMFGCRDEFRALIRRIPALKS